MAHVALPILALLALVAGCGGAEEPRPAGPAPAPDVDLRVTASDGSGSRATARVRCAGDRVRVTGFLARRDAARTCAAARRLGSLLTEPPPADRACAAVYGGPERGRVTGVLPAGRVDRSFARTDACESEEWDRARALLPRPAS